MPPTTASRYLFCSGIIDGEERWLTDPAPFSYRDLPDNIHHAVIEGETWDSLAGRFYAGLERPSGFWWAIANFQPDPVVDPTLKIQAGSTVVIPSRRTLETIILGERRRREYVSA